MSAISPAIPSCPTIMSDTARIYVYYCRNVAPEDQLPPALAGLAGHADVRVEAVPCSGRLDPRYLLKAFESGAAAVCVLACPIEACKSMEGSMRAGRRVCLVKDLMAESGLEPDSLELFRPEGSNMGAVEAAADRVAGFVNSFVKSEQRMATQ